MTLHASMYNTVWKIKFINSTWWLTTNPWSYDSCSWKLVPILPWAHLHYSCSNTSYTTIMVSWSRHRNIYAMVWHDQRWFDGFMQDRSNSIANILDLRQSCTKPSVWWNHVFVTHFILHSYDKAGPQIRLGTYRPLRASYGVSAVRTFGEKTSL